MSRADPSVKLFLRVKLPKGYRYLPAVFEESHGRTVPKIRYAMSKGTETEFPTGTSRFAMFNGRETDFPNGTYYVRSYVKGQKVYQVVRYRHPLEISGALNKAHADALKASQALPAQGHRQPSKHPTAAPETAWKAYIADLKAQHHMEAAGKAAVVSREFQPLSPVQMVKLITRTHVIAYHQYLRSRKKSPRTIADKHVRLKAFLRWTGTPTTFMPPPPKYEKKEPEIYDPVQLAAIRRAAANDPYMTTLIEMALMLGLRMQELKFACWDDLDIHDGVFTVRGKPDLGFVVKDNEQREVPVPSGLLNRLIAFRENQGVQSPKLRDSTNCRRLILGTAADKPNNHLLRALKRLATRAHLDPTIYTLHCFRRTFLTMSLRGDFDARTVQKMAGHSELTTTLRYLKPMAAKETRAKASAIWD